MHCVIMINRTLLEFFQPLLFETTDWFDQILARLISVARFEFVIGRRQASESSILAPSTLNTAQTNYHSK